MVMVMIFFRAQQAKPLPHSLVGKRMASENVMWQGGWLADNMTSKWWWWWWIEMMMMVMVMVMVMVMMMMMMGWRWRHPSSSSCQSQWPTWRGRDVASQSFSLPAGKEKSHCHVITIVIITKSNITWYHHHHHHHHHHLPDAPPPPTSSPPTPPTCPGELIQPLPGIVINHHHYFQNLLNFPFFSIFVSPSKCPITD